MQSTQSDKLTQKLGQLIKQYRTLDESQDTFAKRLGITRKTLASLEDGKGAKLSTLCEALVILELDGQFTDLAIELIDDVSGDSPRQRQSKKRDVLDNDF